MEENYVYPAEVKEENGLYQLRFIDFPEITLVEEKTMDELIRSAQESLALAILDYESMGQELPKPTSNKSDVVYIHVWLPYFRNATKEIYVKKNVTIPQWLDLLAKSIILFLSPYLLRLTFDSKFLFYSFYQCCRIIYITFFC